MEINTGLVEDHKDEKNEITLEEAAAKKRLGDGGFYTIDPRTNEEFFVPYEKLVLLKTEEMNV